MKIKTLTSSDDLQQLYYFLNKIPPLWGNKEAKDVFRNKHVEAFVSQERFDIFAGYDNNNEIICLGSIYYWKDSQRFTLGSLSSSQPASVSNFKDIYAPMVNHILYEGIKNKRTICYRAFPLKYYNVWEKMLSNNCPLYNNFEYYIDQVIPENSWPIHDWQRYFIMNMLWPMPIVVKYGKLKTNNIDD